MRDRSTLTAELTASHVKAIASSKNKLTSSVIVLEGSAAKSAQSATLSSKACANMADILPAARAAAAAKAWRLVFNGNAILIFSWSWCLSSCVATQITCLFLVVCVLCVVCSVLCVVRCVLCVACCCLLTAHLHPVTYLSNINRVVIKKQNLVARTIVFCFIRGTTLLILLYTTTRSTLSR